MSRFTEDQIRKAIRAIDSVPYRVPIDARALARDMAIAVLDTVDDHSPIAHTPGPFGMGDRVRKKTGSSWQGRIVGWYSTELTPLGYAVESERERGSVQIYPAQALERVTPITENSGAALGRFPFPRD